MPETFDATKRYPVLVHVYGGPTSQMVRRDASRYLLDQQRSRSEPAFRKLPETDRVNRRPLIFSPSGEHLLFEVRDESRPRSEMRMVPLAGGPGVRLYSIEQDGLLSRRLGFGADDEIVVLTVLKSVM